MTIVSTSIPHVAAYPHVNHINRCSGFEWRIYIVNIDGHLVLLKSALTKFADNVEFLDFLAKDNIWWQKVAPGIKEIASPWKQTRTESFSRLATLHFGALNTFPPSGAFQNILGYNSVFVGNDIRGGRYHFTYDSQYGLGDIAWLEQSDWGKRSD